MRAGPVHLFAVSSDSREPDGISSTSVQAQWLRDRMGASTAAWQVPLVHHPPYSSGGGTSTTIRWPYKAWGADAVVAGHAHVYERIETGGLTYMTNGLGGAARHSFTTPVAGSQVRYAADVGAMLVQANSQAITFQFINRAGVVIDTRTLNAPAASRTDTLVAKGSAWRFLDDGSDRGTAWRAAGFNDASWESGPGRLGYGHGDEATVVDFGPDPNNKPCTTYFRRSFNVADAGVYGAVALNLLRDDGAVVYVNGVEVARSNLPAGPITCTTRATMAVGGADETTYHRFDLPPSVLRTGINVLAVEIHQASRTSLDLAFDLELLATTRA
jgi:hypothetical protein